MTGSGRSFQRLYKRQGRIKSGYIRAPKLRKLREGGLPGGKVGIPGQGRMVEMVEALRGGPETSMEQVRPRKQAEKVQKCKKWKSENFEVV